MERKGNTLYFKPDEKDKFLRAIPLVGRIVGCSPEEGADIAEHEKEHINEAKRLGHENSIKGYNIVVGKRLGVSIEGLSLLFGIRPYMKARVTLDDSLIPGSDITSICMAPGDPSKADIYTATRAKKGLLGLQG
ncbi:MAG: hypothetical protein IIA87_04115 [Nanoarchaeota archaeon]|nr:hypothetical protein [Nanoarchaeota archaeon]